MIKQFLRECNIDSLHFFSERFCLWKRQNAPYCQFEVLFCFVFFEVLIPEINTKSVFFSFIFTIFLGTQTFNIVPSGKFLNEGLQCLVCVACNHVANVTSSNSTNLILHVKEAGMYWAGWQT